MNCSKTHEKWTNCHHCKVFWLIKELRIGKIGLIKAIFQPNINVIAQIKPRDVSHARFASVVRKIQFLSGTFPLGPVDAVLLLSCSLRGGTSKHTHGQNESLGWTASIVNSVSLGLPYNVFQGGLYRCLKSNQKALLSHGKVE